MVLPAPAYPVIGIVYLSRNISQLGPQFVRSLCWALGVAVSTITPIIALTFKYQNRIVSNVIEQTLPRISNMKILGIGVSTWSTMFLTMGETSLLVSLIMGEIFKKEKNKGLFQSVLAKNGVQVGPYATVTEDGRVRVSTPGAAGGTHKDKQQQQRLHQRAIEKAQQTSTHYGQRMGLWMLTLPLNFVPVLGPLTFCYINGSARGPYIHKRYFDMKEMTLQEREEWMAKHKREYTTFGVIAQGLELLPFVGFLFGFTNTIGAALWAADLEQQQYELRKRKLREATAVPLNA
ncbi:hypothetical protein BGW42_003072 [Actinomortierella wolfii]|nr:hypothetical protein BGW41_003983 [Actinomortierella wolfii]KAG0236656.1 hypothetical protein BGW42_003072 [Actinomortierella wolfii]